MDFLRIRQKARERAREREESARAAASPAAPAELVPAPIPEDRSSSAAPPVAVADASPAASIAPPASPPPAAASPASPPSPAPPATRFAMLPLPELAAAAPPAATEVAAALTDELAQLEEALRAELTGVGSSVPGAPAGEGAADPLDEFFWREDETAPRLPDLVAASELPAPEPPPVRREWLTFRLGAEEYALEIEHVREVLKPPPLTEVPRAPADILGVIMVRGQVVAVIDPRARLGLPRAEPGPRARVLVCDAGEVSCGVLVDAVSSVIRLAPSAVEPRPPGVGGEAAEYIAGIGRDRNRLYILLDARALLGDVTGARSAGAIS